MMRTGIAIISAFAAALTPTAAELLPAQVAASWVAISDSAAPSQPLHTAISMKHAPGWHSYWLNPGEAGLATTIKWKLPTGWKAGELGFPVPTRFHAGGLASFGYEGDIMLPVTLTPPAGFEGKAQLTAVLSWLACSEDGCVPGKAELSMEITAGNPQPGPAAAEILAAIDRLPRPAGDAVPLMVTEDGKSLTLTLRASETAPLDFTLYEVFPLTPDVIPPGAEIRFSRNENVWVATVPKGDFAKEPVKSLTLVLAAKDASAPLEVTWNKP